MHQEGRKEMFYLTMHSTHFFPSVMKVGWWGDIPDDKMKFVVYQSMAFFLLLLLCCHLNFHLDVLCVTNVRYFNN